MSMMISYLYSLSCPDSDATGPYRFEKVDYTNIQSSTLLTIIPWIGRIKNDKKIRYSLVLVVIGITFILLISSSLLLHERNMQDSYRRLSPHRPPKTLLLDDGTLSTPQHGLGDTLCDYFTQSSKRHTEIKTIHLDLKELKMEDYLGAKLIANAAQVPLLVTGNNVRGLRHQAFRVGPAPKDHGKTWTANYLCQRCTMPLCQDHLHLLPEAVQSKHMFRKPK
jgi:hypothetical protein